MSRCVNSCRPYIPYLANENGQHKFRENTTGKHFYLEN